MNLYPPEQDNIPFSFNLMPVVETCYAIDMLNVSLPQPVNYTSLILQHPIAKQVEPLFQQVPQPIKYSTFQGRDFKADSWNDFNYNSYNAFVNQVTPVSSNNKVENNITVTLASNSNNVPAKAANTKKFYIIGGVIILLIVALIVIVVISLASSKKSDFSSSITQQQSTIYAGSGKTTDSTSTTKIITTIVSKPFTSATKTTTSTKALTILTTGLLNSNNATKTTTLTASLYAQCGGLNYIAPTVCITGTYCYASSEWFSQCLFSCPSGWLCPSSAPSNNSGVSLYGQCGGVSYSGEKKCITGLTCFVQDAYYSQCLFSCPSGWLCS